MQDSQRQDFEARLARLGAPRAAPAVAASENIVTQAEAPTRKFETTDDTLKGRLEYPVSVLWSFAFGILSVFLARLVLAHSGGIPDPDESMSLYMIDLAISGATLFAIKIAMGTADKVRSIAGTIGLVLAVHTMHNLFWIFPDQLSLLYGAEWVEALLQRSEPSSIFFRGQYILIE